MPSGRCARNVEKDGQVKNKPRTVLDELKSRGLIARPTFKKLDRFDNDPDLNEIGQ
jgi:hypothetical protein